MIGPDEFQEIENAAIQRFMESLDHPDPKLADAVVQIAARVAAIAIQEYDRKLREKDELKG